MAPFGLGLGIGSQSKHRGGAGNSLVWRGLNQAAQITIQANSNFADRLARTTRNRRYSNVSFRRFRVAIPVFNPGAASFTGSLSGTTLTVAAWVGTFGGASLNPGAGLASGAAAGTKIVQQLTNTNPSGYAGREGTYEVSISQTVASRAMTTEVSDTLHDGPLSQLTFQFGFEYPFTNSLTGIPARIPVTFNGARTAAYNRATWNTNTGWIVSDIIDVGVTVPAGAFFGAWFTLEMPAAVQNAIPGTTATNFLQKYLGCTDHTTSAIAADFAVSSSSAGSAFTTQGGGSQFYDPTMLLLEVPVGTKCVAAIGDSICYGVGEGVTGSGNYGDASGSPLGNMGYVARGIFETAGLNGVVFGRGSDGDKYVANPINWRYRREGVVLANPTHFINQNGHNDALVATISPAWTATTAYAFGDAVIRNATGGGTFICTKAGTSGSVALSGTPGQISQDGTAEWYCYSASTTTAAQNPAGVLSRKSKINKLVKDLLPSAKLLATTITPDAAGTRSVTSLTSVGTTVTATVASTADLATGQEVVISGASPTTYNATAIITVQNGTTFTYTVGVTPSSSPAVGAPVYNNEYRSAAGQTPNPGFAPGGIRDLVNQAIRQKHPYLLLDDMIEVNSIFENDMVAADGKWFVDGTPWLNVWDGTHPNSHGAARGAAAITASKFT